MDSRNVLFLFFDGPLPAVALVGVGAAVYGITLMGLSTRFRQKATGLLRSVSA